MIMELHGIHCTVEIYDRNLLSQKKSRSAILTFSLNDEGNNICLYLQTQDNQGTKYQIANNIVFEKFKYSERKATLRVIQPCHDIIIQSNDIEYTFSRFMLELKSLTFLCASNNKFDRRNLNRCITSLTSLSSKRFSSLQRTKIIIKKKFEYPTLQGFPERTEQLFLSELDTRSFDRQILRLQSLRTLVLSNNKISSLPKELGTLPHLQQLDVSQNFLGRSAQSRWAWIEQSAVKNNLRLLDISHNSLTKLPAQIGKLQSLETLQIRQNLLTHLPQSIGTLRHLKYLDVAKNSLLYLPAIIEDLGLHFINISDNPFLYLHGYHSDFLFYNFASKFEINVGIPSLAELSAKCVIKSRLTYASLIPLSLVEYLDEAKYCLICKNACFDHYVRKITPCLSFMRGPHCLEYYFCSIKCFKSFSFTTSCFLLNLRCGL